MYVVILNVYSESLCKKGIKKREKFFQYGPFDEFKDAQEYMDEEMRKQLLKTKNNGFLFETESSINHDRVSIGIDMPCYYKCYDYHIKKSDV